MLIQRRDRLFSYFISALFDLNLNVLFFSLTTFNKTDVTPLKFYKYEGKWIQDGTRYNHIHQTMGYLTVVYQLLMMLLLLKKQTGRDRKEEEENDVEWIKEWTERTKNNKLLHTIMKQWAKEGAFNSSSSHNFQYLYWKCQKFFKGNW